MFLLLNAHHTVTGVKPTTKQAGETRIMRVNMRDKNDRKYADNLRGNQDIFLADLMNSAEFIEIKNKHLSDVFTGIESLLGKVMDDESIAGKKIHAAAKEITERFKLREDVATRLLLSHRLTLPMHLDYTPRVYEDGRHVFIRIGAKTTQEDVIKAWKQVKEEQKKLGSVGSKSSINSELAFCIYRQYVLNGRGIKDIFTDYENGELEGYDHASTIRDRKEFKRYYDKTVRGLLIR